MCLVTDAQFQGSTLNGAGSNHFRPFAFQRKTKTKMIYFIECDEITRLTVFGHFLLLRFFIDFGVAYFDLLMWPGRVSAKPEKIQFGNIFGNYAS